MPKYGLDGLRLGAVCRGGSVRAEDRQQNMETDFMAP